MGEMFCQSFANLEISQAIPVSTKKTKKTGLISHLSVHTGAFVGGGGGPIIHDSLCPTAGVPRLDPGNPPHGPRPLTFWALL